jgi:hypothetical protein
MPVDDVDRERVTTGSVRVEVVYTACDWVKPIYGTDHDWDILEADEERHPGA